MPENGLEVLSKKIDALEESVGEIRQRLFSLERKLLVTGTMLTHGEVLPEPKKRVEIEHIRLFAESLGKISPEFILRLKELDEDQDECCPMISGAGLD